MTEASTELNRLGDLYWMTVSELSPTAATLWGVHDFDDQIGSWDVDHLGAFADRLRGIAAAAEAVDTSAASLQDRISLNLLTWQARTVADDIELRFPIGAVDPYIGAHMVLINYPRQNTVQTVEQAYALLGRYENMPSYLDGAFWFQKENADRGMTPAAASVARVLDQLDRYLVSSLEDDALLQLRLPEEGTDWKERATAIVTGAIRPAVEEYRARLIEHIAPLGRPDDRCGLTWMTDGDAIYNHNIGKYTQLDKSPQVIHEIGREWATEINAAEWGEIGGRTLGVNTIEGVFAALRNDPSLHFSSEDEMLTHARDAIARAWDAVDDWFGARPDTPCDVVPVPAAVAPASPPAYYMPPPLDRSRPGTYFLNTYKPEERDRFEYESIHFHEAIPGHHFDRSLASELEGIPTFRRYANVFAHTEGWGLYSERLADEMGLYSSDIDRLGMVSADAWRAGRLVTDTGIHALGWSRQQAIGFLRKWTPIGLLTVEQEIDRYIGMPGQALAYKMGQLEILRLRGHAQEQLGSVFDIKGFHDTMLTSGAMPLPMLETAVEDWIQSQRPEVEV